MDQGMTLAYRRLLLLRKQAKVIRMQWLVIAVLAVALILSITANAMKEETQWTSLAIASTPAPVTIAPATTSAGPTISAATGPTISATAGPTISATAETIETTELVNLGEFRLTAYCACKKCCGKDPGDPAYGITRSGARAKAGRTVAVDPNVIPLGTEVTINGHTYVAEDTGSGINEKCVDVFFDDHQEALTFGVQYADVYIMN